MNLVVDNTVEVTGNEKNDIGMVVSSCNSYDVPLFSFIIYEVFLIYFFFCRLFEES
ncbi:hypothetical protein B296_00019165 [Ensete ventricosum]|uniref:Uncharacterized protein n=1 Tax=Ensete ventricosum TaxID=4639 RepID=A0A427AIS9_ENSVE|nr:hypothetical protein B296_00019165 [Ensete ventricosum]